MERYHIYKLGIAILFYAIYNRRSIMAGALSTQQNGNGDEFVYYQGVQGKPGIDFPVYARIPRTSFNCKKVESGYYADLETNCQVFHICNGGAKISFLCPNGTIFQQSDLICEWWFKVNCTNSPNFYSESAEQLREGSWNKKDNRKSGRNRNTSSKSTLESNDVRRNEIVSGFNNKLPEEHKDTTILDSRTEQIYEPSRSEIEELRKKQANGDRGGRKFKQKNYNNINVRNELTESDVTNSDEAQVPQETASFYKNNQNTIQSFDKPTTNRYPNHKETYSEIQQPKFYSTKAINTFSQTIPPQTFSTNRIPLNEGKPFIVSTPKSAYNIQFSGISNSPNEFNRATTESFRYSPTVPPFTTRKSQSTTVIPKVIVDLDAGSDVSDRNYNNGFSSSGQSYYNKPTQSNKNPNNKAEYTTPHAITASGDHKGISFTEKINTFSGLEDIIHTPANKYDDFKVNIDSVSTSNVNNGVNGGHETSTINSYNPSTISSTSDKYNVNSKSNLKSHSFSNHYETTTKDSYFPSIIVATSVKYGVDSDVGTNHTLLTSSNLPRTTESNYYHYNSDTQNNSEENKHHTTIQDSYYPVAVNSPTASAGGSILNSSQFGVAQHNPINTIQESKNDGSLKGLFSNTAKANNDLQNYPPSVYVDGNQDKSIVASRNTNNSNRNSIPNNSFSGKELFVNSGTTTAGPPSRSNEQNENKQISEVVQHNNKVTENNTENPINTKEQEEPQSSYGDACEDDIVYAELPPDQIIIGKPRMVIDDTTIPTTEKDIVKITVNNVNPVLAKLPSDSEKATSKSVTDSTIFKINVKYGQQTGSTNKPNGYYVTRQFDENNEQLTSQLSTTFFNKNTYLPKKTSYLTTENYSQTNPHTYLPKRPTPAPFSINRSNIDLLSNKDIVEESSGFPQSVNTRENHLKTSAGVPQISEDIQQQFALKPKPFELPPKESIETKVSVVRNSELITSAPLPDYKVSSARPFSIAPGNYEENTIYPTLATPFSTRNSKISEHLQSMLNTLNEIINERNNKINGTDSPRPGLVIPPSVGPQTLHTLAVYFANALDGISSENSDQLPNIDESQAINQLLTHSTINRYRELFKGENDPVVTTLTPEVETDESNDLEGQHSKTAVTPRVRQLAQVFTKALSSYLDDPDMFKKVLEEARPTEPPISNNGKGYGVDDDELLNYSDADIKPNLPRLPTTTAAPIPTWAYILASNNSNSYDYNTLNGDGEHLQSSDSQSFASQFNNYIKDKHFNKGTPNTLGTTPLIQTDKLNLPSNHWTSSVNATKLWQDKLYTNPQAINEDLNVPTIVSDSREGGATESNESSESNIPPGYTGINYGITNLPKMELNSTQVDKILVDIVNSSRNDGNKLKRILHKLNTTQEDFLAKMREIEQNPLTRRLILLLISECGSNLTHLENPSESGVQSSTSNASNKQTDLFESSRAAEQNKFRKGSSPFPVYVDPSLKDEDEDNRALQLLNSLYTIAAKYGK